MVVMHDMFLGAFSEIPSTALRNDSSASLNEFNVSGPRFLTITHPMKFAKVLKKGKKSIFDIWILELWILGKHVSHNLCYFKNAIPDRCLRYDFVKRNQIWKANWIHVVVLSDCYVHIACYPIQNLQRIPLEQKHFSIHRGRVVWSFDRWTVFPQHWLILNLLILFIPQKSILENLQLSFHLTAAKHFSWCLEVQWSAKHSQLCFTMSIVCCLVIGRESKGNLAVILDAILFSDPRIPWPYRHIFIHYTG